MRYNRCKESVMNKMRHRLMFRQVQGEGPNNPPFDFLKAKMAADVCWAIDSTLNTCGNILRTCFSVPNIRDINKTLMDKMKILLDSIKVSCLLSKFIV